MERPQATGNVTSVVLVAFGLLADGVGVASVIKAAPTLVLTMSCVVGLAAGVTALVVFRRQAVGWNILGAVLLVVVGAFAGGAIAGQRWPGPPTATPGSLDLYVQRPSDGNTVGAAADVTVHTPVLTQDQHVWVLIQFRGQSQIWPEGECRKTASRQYVCKSVQFGDATKSLGVPMQITAAIVDDKGNLTYAGFRVSGYPERNPPVRPLVESATINVQRI